MKVGDIWAQLESDLDWRHEEMRLLSNSVATLTREADRDLARRAQLVMLYAHIEGFSKVALSTYVRAINDLGLKCRDVNENIVASAFVDIFHGVRFGDPKGKVFKRVLPEDAGLHIFSRQCEFVAEVGSLMNRAVSVPDGAVDTESNLDSKVLRRNLFRLGFPVGRFASYEEDLDELVYRRHSIAHGDDFNPVRRDLYERLQRAAFHFMDELTLSIVESVESSEYLRKPVPAA
jgi:hypothetical protein